MKDKGVSESGAINNNSRIIINADDFGITKGVNRAIFKLAEAKIVTSTSVMSNIPHYLEIKNINSATGIGIHLNLTIGKPVLPTKMISTLINKSGNFFNLPTLIKMTKNGKISKKEVEAEFDAQTKRLIDIGIQPDHINSHQSLLKYPFFIPIFKKIAKKYCIKAVRSYSPRKFVLKRLLSLRKIVKSLYLEYQKIKWKHDGFNVTNKYDSLLGINLTHETAIKRLNEIFHNLPKGVLELTVHPGYCDDDNSLLGNYLYEREIEVNTLLSKDFKKIKENSKAALISFKQL